MGIFKRKIKNTFDIARETGIEEEKIKELKNGERHIEGQTMEKVLDAINRSKIDRAIEKSEIFDWYKTTDLKQLRKKFGYEASLHLAKAINMDSGMLSRIENKKFNMINKPIIRLYDFYHNDFNIRINKPVKVKKKKITYYDERKKIFDWYKTIDFTFLREKFGYTSQNDLAKKLNISVSVINRIENKKYKTLNKSIMMIYKFYNDESNKKQIDELIVPQAKNNDESKVMEWYFNTDIKALRGEKPQKEQAKEIGIPQSSLWEFENHTHRKMCKNLIKIYNFYNNDNLCNKDAIEEEKANEIYNWYISIDDLKDYRRKFGYSLNKMMAVLNTSYDQIRDFESHKYKSATPIVCKFYEFYNDESNRLPEIKLEELNNKKPKFKNNNKNKEDKVAVIPFEYLQKVFENDETENLKKQLEEKDNKIKELERQIMLYEKLIERL